MPSLPARDQSMLGSDCEFLGYPYGGGWQAKFDNGQSFWMPFMKHCGVSAVPNAEPRVLVLDGINNEGFSGGPVVSKTGPEQVILAVISGYIQEPSEVISTATVKKAKKAPKKKSSESSNQAGHLKVNLNSGFIIAYSISYAMDAIQKNPIGPLRR